MALLTPAGAVKALYNLVGSLNPTVTASLGALTVVLGLFEYFDTLWAMLFTRMDSVVIDVVPTLGISPFGLINGFFPLDTALTYLSAHFVLYLVCSGVRMIKSFIPLISG